MLWSTISRSRRFSIVRSTCRIQKPKPPPATTTAQQAQPPRDAKQKKLRRPPSSQVWREARCTRQHIEETTAMVRHTRYTHVTHTLYTRHTHTRARKQRITHKAPSLKTIYTTSEKPRRDTTACTSKTTTIYGKDATQGRRRTRHGHDNNHGTQHTPHTDKLEKSLLFLKHFLSFPPPLAYFPQK